MKIAVISDFDTKGSGYFNIIIPLCNGLAMKGHDVKAAGMGYKGEEHWNKFSIIPAANMKDVLVIIDNLKFLWEFDVLLVALDILIQQGLMGYLDRTQAEYKYVGIFPVESDPMSFDFATAVMQMDKGLCISKFGTEEAKKMNLNNVDYLEIGIDTNAWRPPEGDERNKVRNAYGIEPDTFVVLTVADNQERKNLPVAMKAFADFADKVPNSKYVIVTRSTLSAGWRLDEIAKRFGIQDKFIEIERGLPFKTLWGLYAMSDVFLLLSKAEGLSMPVLEAMAVGLPVIGTDCTAFVEHLSDNRGFLVDYLKDKKHGFPPIDPFGLGYRYWASHFQATGKLLSIYKGKHRHDREGAFEYVRSRTWDKTINMVNNVLEELVDGKETA